MFTSKRNYARWEAKEIANFQSAAANFPSAPTNWPVDCDNKPGLVDKFTTSISV